MTPSFVTIAVSNSLAALGLAAVVWLVTRIFKSPPLAHALWLVVLVKLISPPLFDVPLPSLRLPEKPAAVVLAIENDPARPAATRWLSEPEALPLVTSQSDVPFDPMANFDPIQSDLISDVVEPEPVFEVPQPATETNVIERYTVAPIASMQNALSWPEWLGIVWAAGALLWFSISLIRVLSFRRLLHKTQLASGSLQAEISAMAAEIGLRNTPLVRLARTAIPPLTWALWGRPVVLLPKKLLEDLTDAERKTLLAHELAHLKRRDHVVRWLELAAVGLNWWQPLAWIAQRHLHEASEQCCDAWVLRRFPHLARAYAAALLKTVDFLAEAQPPLPIGSTGFGQARQLKRRFKMILHENRNDRLTWLVRLVVLAVGCVVLPLSVKSLWAEAPQAGLQPGDIIDTRKLREDEQRRQLRQLGALTQDSNNAETVKTQESKATSETKPAENSASGIAEKPLSADAIMHIADTYFEKGRYEDATYYYGLLQTPEAKERLRAAEDKMLKQPRAAMPDFSKPPVNVAVGDAKGDDVDERLQRLESKVEKLVELLERTAKESRPPAVATHPLQNQEAPSPLKDNPPPTSALPKDDISELTAAERKELAALRHAQLEWSHQAADLVRDVQMYEASRDRNNAAEKEYEKANAAYKNGTVSLDLMLETQRKKVEASNDFMQATARLAMLQRNNSNSPTDKRLLAFGKLNRFKNARDEALKNWREVHALYELEAKGGEPDKEAQAREQYFYFRQQVETAHSELNSIDQKLNSWNGRNYR